MTAGLDPIGASLAPRAPARPVPGVKRKDRLRLAEYDRLRDAGIERIPAWRQVCAAPDLAFLNIRPEDRDGRILDHLAWFLGRVAAERIVRGRNDLAETIPDAVNSIGDIIRGDFGEAKVTIRGRGEDAEEVVSIDAAAAGVRSQNARWLLERTGVVAPPSGPGVAVQVNVGDAARSRVAR